MRENRWTLSWKFVLTFHRKSTSLLLTFLEHRTQPVMQVISGYAAYQKTEGRSLCAKDQSPENNSSTKQAR